MSLTGASRPASLGDTISVSKILVGLAWAVVITAAFYFVLRQVPRFFVWSEASYGRYYWPRAELLVPHIAGGLVALTIGPFQFWPRIRNHYRKVHRISGRVYLISIAVGATGAMALAVTSSRGLAYGSGLFGLAVAWMVTSGMAFISIRRRNFVQHKQWMIRSYVVTFAFITFRLMNDIMLYAGIGPATQRLGLISWACWAVPLLITELVLQGSQVFAAQTR